MHSPAFLNSLDVLYDYERQVLSMKAICSPQMECELYDELAYAEIEEWTPIETLQDLKIIVGTEEPEKLYLPFVY